MAATSTRRPRPCSTSSANCCVTAPPALPTTSSRCLPGAEGAALPREVACHAGAERAEQRERCQRHGRLGGLPDRVMFSEQQHHEHGEGKHGTEPCGAEAHPAHDIYEGFGGYSANPAEE